MTPADPALERHARSAVRHAIAAGKLRRKPCEICGRLPAHGHHDDYAQPLAVRWLCPAHHMRLHRENTGACRPWTAEDLAYLREHGHEGAVAVAAALGRSEGAVRVAASRARISLRQTGSSAGPILGQPRGVSLRRDLREALLAGNVDPELLAQRMRTDADAELCPSCATRPIRVKAAGTCRVCHLRRLADAHREALAEREVELVGAK
jgi:hypothetical protein